MAPAYNERDPVVDDADGHGAYVRWDDVYEDNVAWMYRLLFAHVGNRMDAEDLTSEVFLAALRPLRITASRREVRAYLKVAARTALAQHWRRHFKVEVTHISDDVPLPHLGDAPDPRVERQARVVLDALSERHRTILELRFLRGMSVKDAARAMDITVSNAKVLQHRALAAAARRGLGGAVLPRGR